MAAAEAVGAEGLGPAMLGALAARSGVGSATVGSGGHWAADWAAESWEEPAAGRRVAVVWAEASGGRGMEEDWAAQVGGASGSAGASGLAAGWGDLEEGTGRNYWVARVQCGTGMSRGRPQAVQVRRSRENHWRHRWDRGYRS